MREKIAEITMMMPILAVMLAAAGHPVGRLAAGTALVGVFLWWLFARGRS